MNKVHDNSGKIGPRYNRRLRNALIWVYATYWKKELTNQEANQKIIEEYNEGDEFAIFSKQEIYREHTYDAYDNRAFYHDLDRARWYLVNKDTPRKLVRSGFELYRMSEWYIKFHAQHINYDILPADVALNRLFAKIRNSSGEETVRKVSQRNPQLQNDLRVAAIRFQGGCAFGTDLGDRGDLIEAAHLKNHKICTKAERTDPFVVVPLYVPYHKLLERGLIGLTPSGRIMISPELGDAEKKTVPVHPGLKLNKMHESYLPYIEWHTKNTFKK